MEIRKGAVYIYSEDDGEAVSQIPSCPYCKVAEESASADFENYGDYVTIRWYCADCDDWELIESVTWGDWITYY